MEGKEHGEKTKEDLVHGSLMFILVYVERVSKDLR